MSPARRSLRASPGATEDGDGSTRITQRRSRSGAAAATSPVRGKCLETPKSGSAAASAASGRSTSRGRGRSRSRTKKDDEDDAALRTPDKGVKEKTGQEDAETPT